MRRGVAPAVAAGTVMPIREGMDLVSHLVGSVRDSDATNLLARGTIHLSHESNLGEDGVHVDADAARIIVNIFPRARGRGSSRCCFINTRDLSSVQRGSFMSGKSSWMRYTEAYRAPRGVSNEFARETLEYSHRLSGSWGPRLGLGRPERRTPASQVYG